MKKNLHICNIILYAVQYSISLLYIGYEYGEGSLFPYPRGPEYFLLPAVNLVMLVIGVMLMRNSDYCTVKRYVTTAAVAVLYPCLLWGILLWFYFQGRMTSASVWDIVVYPASLVVLSVVIAVNYSICAFQSRSKKEDTV